MLIMYIVTKYPKSHAVFVQRTHVLVVVVVRFIAATKPVTRDDVAASSTRAVEPFGCYSLWFSPDDFTVSFRRLGRLSLGDYWNFHTRPAVQP